MKRERRRHSRITQPFEVRYRLLGALSSPWSSASIINLSAGGIRIRGTESIPAGELLDVEVKLPSRHDALVLQGRAVWHQLQAAEVIEHGIEFVELSPERQLQLDEVVRFIRKSDSGTPPTP